MRPLLFFVGEVKRGVCKPALQDVPFHSIQSLEQLKERFSTVPDERIEENFAGIPPLL